MDRREFAKATALILCPALTRAVQSASEADPAPSAARFAFYDNRFSQARSIALRLGPGQPWRIVSENAAAEWQQRLRPAMSGGPFVAMGITPASVPFCLEVLARERAVIHMTRQRLDPDLILWTLEATPHG